MQALLSNASSEVCHLTCHQMGGRLVLQTCAYWSSRMRRSQHSAYSGHSRDLLRLCSFQGVGPVFHFGRGIPTVLVGARCKAQN